MILLRRRDDLSFQRALLFDAERVGSQTLPVQYWTHVTVNYTLWYRE